jgi:hypothetical protein
MCRMWNAVCCIRMPVKSPFRSVEVSNKSLPNGVRVEVVMPGRFNREPKLRAAEPEQFVTRVVQHKQSIGFLKGHARGIQDGADPKIIP